MWIEKRKYNCFDMIRLPFRVAGLQCFLIVAYAIISALIPSLQVIIVADFIDKAIRIVNQTAEIGEIFLPVIILCLLFLFNHILSLFMNLVQVQFENILRKKLRPGFVERRANLKYCYLENQEAMNTVNRLSNVETNIRQIFNNVISYFALVIRVGGLLYILFSKIWWLTFLIVLISIPLFWLAIKSGRANYKAQVEVTRLTREYTYLGNILVSRDAVDERSMFGYGGEVNKRWLTKYEEARKTQVNTQKNGSLR